MCPHAFGKAEHIYRAHYVSFDGLDRIVLIMDGRRRAGEIIYLIDLKQDRLGHVMADKLKSLVIKQMRDVGLTPRKKIIKTDNLVSVT